MKRDKDRRTAAAAKSPLSRLTKFGDVVEAIVVLVDDVRDEIPGVLGDVMGMPTTRAPESPPHSRASKPLVGKPW